MAKATVAISQDFFNSFAAAAQKQAKQGDGVPVKIPLKSGSKWV